MAFTILFFLHFRNFRLFLLFQISFFFFSTIQHRTFIAKNEPVLGFLPGSTERQNVEESLKRISLETRDIPIVIGGEHIRTQDVHYQVSVRYAVKCLPVLFCLLLTTCQIILPVCSTVYTHYSTGSACIHAG